MLLTPEDIDQMTTAYLTAALFTADEKDIKPTSGEFDPSPYLPRVTKATRAKALAVCTTFAKANIVDLSTYAPDDAGHDLWYTRNGHGVGFWEADHCTKQEGERLTTAAHALGEGYIYKGKGGWFHID